MERITRQAYAKVNIGLDVLRRREDGYHEVRMIMQTVALCDDLLIERSTKPGIRLRTDDPQLPTGQDNLICRAAALLLQERGIREGVQVTLTKRIPVAAGMAGGSADAAAVMHGLNALFGMGYPLARLQELGVKLGADIPYCLAGGTMLAEGIGEILSPLPAPPACHLVVAKPEISVSTAYVYGNLRADALPYHPDIDGMIGALQAQDLRGITDRLGNVLETVTVGAYPVIGQLKELLCKAGAENALMSGSGPTVFGIFRQRETAQKAADAVRASGLAAQIYVTAFHAGAA